MSDGPSHHTSLRAAFAAGGDVGRDLLAVDWSSTAVGEPETWSLSLGNAVRILLTSKFSMWMAWGPDLTFFCNDAYRRDTLGTKYPWALGRPAHEVWSEIWGDIGPRIDQVMSTGEATWDESLLLFLERSGYTEETYHTFSYSPLADDDGTVAGMLCVVAEVTEQVIWERRMRTLRDLGVGVSAAPDEATAVRIACERLADNPASMPFAAVYLFEDDGAVATRAGTAGIEPTHPAVPPVLSGLHALWPVVPAWDGDTCVVEDLSAHGDLPTGAWDRPPHHALVVPLPHPSGARPYGLLVVGVNPYCPLDDAYRDFVELVATHLSGAITGARALDDQRQRAETLAALDQVKSDFLANVSHELRTPLTLLLGPAEDALADRDAVLAPEQQRRLEVIARNGRRMLQLVNSLLDFSRLEAGEDDAVFVPSDLGRATAELAAMFESAAARAGLSLDVSCEPGVEVLLDLEHWSKIVVNLLSNAFKFTFEGGVSVDVRQEDHRAVLRVSDTGTGIVAAELPLLFERFHRVRGARSRSHEGSGIGLALVDQLVRAHGGTVEVDSEMGAGTTFTVRLPLGRDHLPLERIASDEPAGADSRAALRRAGTRVATETAIWRTPVADVLDDEPAPAGGPENPEEPDAPASPARPGRTATVLVVDDNLDMLTYIGVLLRRHGYAVLGAGDGIEALEVLRSRPVDLVVADVMMPRLDGFGLLRAMHADPALTSTPLIMLSARAGEEGTLDGLQAGASDYLVKPFSSRELLARVRTNLALDRAQRVSEALERSQELLAQAQRMAGLGSWEIDLEADAIRASEGFVELLELTSDDLRLGTAQTIAQRVHPDDVERVSATLAALGPGESVSYETRVVLPTRGERVFAVRAERPPSDDGATAVVRGSFQDVTDERLTQQRLATTEAAHQGAARERAIADELQRSLLPPVTIDVDLLDVATYYRAGAGDAHVGGDWYDVIDLGGGRVALVVGDVMGRGVRAAAVTGQLRAAVRALVRVSLEPTEILEHLDGIVQELADEQIVTCVLGVVDAARLTLDYASAGHPPVIVTGTDGTRMLESTGPPLGAGYWNVASSRVQLSPDDVVTFYTDGLVERRASDLGDDIDDLAARLRSLHGRSVQEHVDAISGDVATADTADDIALLVVTVSGPGEHPVLRRRLDHSETAPGEARHVVASHLEASGVPSEVRDDVVLALSELVTNAVTHARPPLSLRVACGADEVVLEVSDRTALRPRQRQPDDDDEHGRGLNIVQALSSSWGTRRTGPGKVVWCRFTW